MEAGADDYITKPFDQHELKVRLRAGTRLVELQAQLLSAREALREQATKDWLTKVWNRSSILDLLSRELARSGREARPVGLVLVDLDHFKNVNDTLGHFAGDAVLREAAVRMLSAIRPYDSVGRYGGEEFLILLPGCDEQATCGLAERVRAQIAKDEVAAGETTLSLTASFGATSVMARQGITAEELIRKADEAMYLAKRLGRNRVELLPFDSPDAVPAPPSVETIAQ
jgi:diguanylate cyclase (GGDEF)-like protein